MYIINLTSGSTQGLVQFSLNLTGGKYKFNFYYNNIGWAICTSEFSVIISVPTFTTLQSSYNGG